MYKRQVPRGIHLANSEVFINDGAKSDTGNIGDILRHDNSVGVTDPIYPVYIDSNVMCGRAGVLEEATGRWSNVTYMPCTSENNFIPAIPVSYTHLRAHETRHDLVCRLLLEKKNMKKNQKHTLI